ncbi:hypothetical protein STVA_41680 [Allostella vacuolata]|nr:hypothetical protein STVA_41680 [Stella vacuolata]
MVRLVLAGLLLALAAPPAEAANCRKGKPCGGACIARDKVCRVGGSGAGLVRPNAEISRARAVEDAPPARSDGPPLVPCRWAGVVYRVPSVLCTDGGGFVVR